MMKVRVSCLAALLLATGCSGAGQSDPLEDGTSESTPVGAATSVEESPDLLYSDESFELRVDPGRTGDVVVEAVPSDQLPALPDGLSLVGEVIYSVDQGPVLPTDEPIEMSFLTGDDGQEHVLAHLTDAGTWEYFIVLSQGGAVVWQTNDFWGYNLLNNPVTDFIGRGIGAVGEATDFVFDFVVGTTDAPTNCDYAGGNGADWVTNTGSPGNALVHFCVRERESDLVEAVITSNSDSPVLVTIPSAGQAEWVWSEDYADWASRLLSFVLGSDNDYYLAPGRTMTVGLRRPPNGVGVGHDFVFTQDQTAQLLGLVGEYAGSGSTELMGLLMLVCMVEAQWPTVDGVEALAQIWSLCVKDELISRGFEALAKNTVDTYVEQLAAVSSGNRARSFWRSIPTSSARIESALERHRAWKPGAANSYLAAELLADATTGLTLALASWEPANAESTVFINGWCSAAGLALERNTSQATLIRTGVSDNDAGIASVGEGEALLVFPEQGTPNPDWIMAMPVDGRECGFVRESHLVPPPVNLATVGYDNCQNRCQITGRVVIDHPAWGETAVLTYRARPEPGFGGIVAIGADGAVRWHRELNEASRWSLGILGGESENQFPHELESPVDALGHIFVLYNPGRFDGVIILRPTSDSFETFNTVPDPDDYNGRFYNAGITDRDLDGVYEIVHFTQDCNPTCAGGSITSVALMWAGLDYAEEVPQAPSTSGAQTCVSDQPCSPGELRKAFVAALGATNEDRLGALATPSALTELYAWWNPELGEVLQAHTDNCDVEGESSDCAITYVDPAPVLYILHMSREPTGWRITRIEFLHTG